MHKLRNFLSFLTIQLISSCIFHYMARTIQAATLILCLEIFSAKYFPVPKCYSSTKTGVPFRNLLAAFPTVTPFSGNLGPLSMYVTTLLASVTQFWSNCCIFPCDGNMHLLVPNICFLQRDTTSTGRMEVILTVGKWLPQLWRLTGLMVCGQQAGVPQGVLQFQPKGVWAKAFTWVGKWRNYF